MASEDKVSVTVGRETFRYWLRREVSCFKTQKEAAQEWGISPQFLSDLLKGNREPGEDLLARLKLRKIVTYVPTE